MPSTSPTTPTLRRSAKRPLSRSADLRDAAASADRARRLERSSRGTSRTGAERSPVRHIATLVSARPYLDVSG
jgi:hypothetical protein